MNERKLGFGLMRLPKTEEKAIDLDHLKRMVDLFLERGFTYFDTAWMYCDFQSECAVKEALVSRYPRDSFTLATKLHCGFLKNKEDRDRVFNEQLQKTGAGFFDYYLLHDINAHSLKTYEELDCFRWIQEKKQQGLVKTIGFSFHDTADLLDEVLSAHPEFEFVQLQINYIDWESAGIQSRACYEVAVKHGKKVVVMEPVKGGMLASLPGTVGELFESVHPDWSQASWAIRFAASLENVMMVLSGMSTLEQLDENTAYMADFQPLNEQELAVVRSAVEAINASVAIPCTGCAYCVSGCPMQINIPRAFSLYNADLQDEKGWVQSAYYDNMVAGSGKASACIGCGQCEGICPQHLPIIDHLKTVAKHFE